MTAPAILLIISLYWTYSSIVYLTFSWESFFQLFVALFCSAFFIYDICKQRKMKYDSEAIYLTTFFSKKTEKVKYSNIIIFSINLKHRFPPSTQYVIKYCKDDGKKDVAFITVTWFEENKFFMTLKVKLPSNKINI